MANNNKSVSLTDQAYENIKTNILNLTYPPGMALTEALLCSQLGMSRSPVRAAIHRLQTEGLIVSDYYKSMTVKEITDKLEAGLKELFESEKYKSYLSTMSKFHNYSFNNTLLIAMQKPDASLIAGFNAWKNNFGRNVMRGEKGIRILAPSPYKIRQEVEKKDPQTGKTVTDSNGKPVMETKEIQIPAYKVVAVFDVSQTEGGLHPQ